MTIPMEPDDDQRVVLQEGSSREFRYMAVYPASNLLSGTLCVQANKAGQISADWMIRWMEDNPSRVDWDK
jgi:hypothetical protein